jgi:hypothetical protein
MIRQTRSRVRPVITGDEALRGLAGNPATPLGLLDVKDHIRGQLELARRRLTAILAA